MKKKGEHATAEVSSKYAYGEKGCAVLDIPPNANLNYEIHLKSFTEPKSKWSMELDEKRELALQRKNQGNDAFAQGHYKFSIKKYKAALEFVEDDNKITGDEKKQVNTNICLPCHLNLAMCYIKIGDFASALKSAEKALEIDSKNVKGLWRRGLAKQERKDWEDARRDFKAALEIEPDNKYIKQSLAKVNQLIAKYEEQEKQKYKNMFG